MTVVPLFCARFIKAPSHHGTPSTERPVEVDKPKRRWSVGRRFNVWFNDRFESFLKVYDRLVGGTLRRPAAGAVGFAAVFVVQPRHCFRCSGCRSSRARTPASSSSTSKRRRGTRLSVTESEVAKVEDLMRQIVPPEDLGMIVSNIGATPDFSAIYTTNSAMHTAFVQVSLKEDHKTGSYEYMAPRARRGCRPSCRS